MIEKMPSFQKTARLAGLFYLLIIMAALYGHMYVPLQLFVKGNTVATTGNILDNELLFRTCIVAGIMEALGLLFLSITLFRLFSEVHKQASGMIVAMAVVQVSVIFMLTTCKVMALLILKGEVTFSSGAQSVPDLAMLFLQIARYGGLMMGCLSGLWLLSFGFLIHRSRFLPRVLGIMLALAGCCYILNVLVVILMPAYGSQMQLLVFIGFLLAEVPVMLWLLFKGIRDYVSIEIIEEGNSRAMPAALAVKDYTL